MEKDQAVGQNDSGFLEDRDPEKYSDHSSDEEDDLDGGGVSMEYIRKYLSNKLSIGDDDQRNPSVLEEVNFDGIVQYIKDKKANNIVVMAGAGISTSAGIPDFRTPGSGLYDNLQKYNLPDPISVFDIRFFRENPKPFFDLAKELYPGSFQPTISHFFVRLLHEKGLLQRHYTQNIDTLERVAGVPDDKLVEAHGAFHVGHCIKPSCRQEYSQEWIKDRIFKDIIPTCNLCQNFVKPDIVFFGENLPERFFRLAQVDFKKCDLLIIMGTSLVVHPFASLVDRVNDTCPRLLINMEKVGVRNELESMMGRGGLALDSTNNYRDVAWLGDCDEGCKALAEALGWKEDLENLAKSSMVLAQDANDEISNVLVDETEDMRPIVVVEKDKADVPTEDVLEVNLEENFGFAVVPLTWCPHLETVSDSIKVDVSAPCEKCLETKENWVCLACNAVACSRYAKNHMVDHNQRTEHQMVLSYSDLSVWCYGCDSYVNNEKLERVKMDAYKDKFKC